MNQGTKSQSNVRDVVAVVDGWGQFSTDHPGLSGAPQIIKAIGVVPIDLEQMLPGAQGRFELKFLGDGVFAQLSLFSCGQH
jgi:hypothetical protein